MSHIEILESQIDKSNYIKLIEDVGWEKYINYEAIDIALENSLWSAIAKDTSTNDTVGFVRIVGDGAMFFYIQDLMVLGSYQKQGIGNQLMQVACEYLKNNAPAKALVSLFTHKSKMTFFRAFEFNGSEAGLSGMYKKLW